MRTIKLWQRRGLCGVVSMVVLGVCGCHKTALVYGPAAPPTDKYSADQAAKHKLPGIPFYSHSGVCTKESVWLEPQTTLTLTVAPEGEAPVTHTVTLNNRAFHENSMASEFVAALTALDKGQFKIEGPDSPYCPSAVAKDWSVIAQTYHVIQADEATVIADRGNVVLMTNTAEIGTAVDYTRVYYLNTNSPLNGTSSVDAHLNADGTLGEGSVSKDDETLSTALTTLGTLGTGALSAFSTIDAAHITASATSVTPTGAAPMVQMVGGKPYACKADGLWPGVPLHGTVTYKFTATPGGLLHAHKDVSPLPDNGSCVASDAKPVRGGSFTVTPVAGGDKPDKTAYTVSGSITPPKPKDGK